MRYKNTEKTIVVLGDRESVGPFGITRDFTPKEIESLPGIEAAVRRGMLKPYDGPDPEVKQEAKKPAVWHTEMSSSGEPVKAKTSTGKVVEYVVADADTADAVAMSDPSTVTSLEGKKSVDYIEEGVNARPYMNASEAQDAQFDAENEAANPDDEEGLAENEFDRNSIKDVDEEMAQHARDLATQPRETRQVEVGNIETEQNEKTMTVDKTRSASDAMDAELDAENADSDFDDEATLAENEAEIGEHPDADDEIAKDTSQVFVKNSGSKGGSQPQAVDVVVQEATSKALSEVEKSTRPNYDDGEVVHSTTGKVSEFLRQPLPAKKWAIAKETDPGFLKDVRKHTQSENVRSLVDQRMSELEKAESQVEKK